MCFSRRTLLHEVGEFVLGFKFMYTCKKNNLFLLGAGLQWRPKLPLRCVFLQHFIHLYFVPVVTYSLCLMKEEAT
jgi:hypothetical protein